MKKNIRMMKSSNELNIEENKKNKKNKKLKKNNILQKIMEMRRIIIIFYQV